MTGVQTCALPISDFIAKGDALVPTNFLNPFNDVVSQPAFTPQGIARSLSPGLKVPLAFTLGLEPGNSFAEPFRPITRPYGENRNMFTDAIAAGLRSFPITREAMYVAPTGSIGPLGLGPHPRYNSGRNMVDNNGNPIDTNPRALGLMRLIGLPAPTPVEDADAIVEAANKQTGLMARKRRHVVYG